MPAPTNLKLLTDVLDGTAAIWDTDEAHLVINTARTFKMQLPLSVLEQVNNTLERIAPPGYTLKYEQYGSGFRVVCQQIGTQLPAESGDNTP
jgi:hypothetical protein